MCKAPTIIFILKETKQNNFSAKLAFSNLLLSKLMRFYSIAHRIRLFFSRTVHTETPENAHLIDSTRIRRFFRRRFRSIAHRICFFFHLTSTPKRPKTLMESTTRVYYRRFLTPFSNASDRRKQMRRILAN